MGKGSYFGCGTVIGPKDASWFGFSSVGGGVRADGDLVAKRQANPLTSVAEKRISNLRIDVIGLKGDLARVDEQRAAISERLVRSRQDLAMLLRSHGLPLDVGLTEPPVAKPQKNTKPNRAERRAKFKRKEV